MYAVIRKLHMRSVDEAGRRAADGLAPILKQSPGFAGYDVIRFAGDTGGSITLFDTKEAAEEAHRKALGWIKENLADLIEGEPEVMAGEVLAAITPQPASSGRATAA